MSDLASVLLIILLFTATAGLGWTVERLREER